jgi:hypothetical protein
MEDLIKSFVQAKASLTQMEIQVKQSNINFKAFEKQLAREMTQLGLKSLQVHKYGITLNCNGETVRVYQWRHKYDEVTLNDAIKKPELLRSVELFLRARNSKQQNEQERANTRDTVERRESRIINATPGKEPQVKIQNASNKVTLGIDRRQGKVRLYKQTAKKV